MIRHAYDFNNIHLQACSFHNDELRNEKDVERA